jgi:dTDP-3-amino-3,4,6-trideoxy-alpha-D-glucose transaminase
MIVQAAPHHRIERFRGEIDVAIDAFLRKGEFVLGGPVKQFENNFCAQFGFNHCVGVGSGTSALTLALQAVGVKAGDEVITVSMTAAGTAQAILLCGAIPRFVDIDIKSRCMNVGLVEAAITGKTKAIVPVHLYGHAVDMAALMKIANAKGLMVVEDCAQAIGTTLGGKSVGNFGHAAAFSFYPTKNLGCIGDGGAVVCGAEATATNVRRLANYGWADGRRISEEAAGNSRLDGLQAAILSTLLPHLATGNQERRDIAATYCQAFRGLNIGLPPEDDGDCYHQFAIVVENRDHVIETLRDRYQVLTAVHYAPPLHHQPAFKTLDVPYLPQTDYLAGHVLSLPIQPEVAKPHLREIIDAVIASVTL